jgi:hypothetical protein
MLKLSSVWCDGMSQLESTRPPAKPPSGGNVQPACLESGSSMKDRSFVVVSDSMLEPYR